MKNEIINCLTWYANKVAETVQYESWSDEFCRKEIRESTDKFIKTLNKHINWDNLTEEDCKELRFGLWMSDEEIDEDVKNLKKEIKGQVLEDEISKLERVKGLRLIPLYLLPIVPIGTELTSIFGDVIKYDGFNVDKDVRFGCIAYGIRLKED